MKRKKKLILWTLAVFVVGAIALVFAGELVIQHRAEVRKRDGIAASIAGDDEKAAELLGRYLARRPNDTDVLPYYIKSRERVELPNGQHLVDTMAALKILVGLEPDRLDDRRHLLELYARFGRLPEALDSANAILNNTAHPQWADDVRTLEIKTEVLQKLQKDHEALDTAEKWAKLAPTDFRAQMARMRLHALLKHPQKMLIDDAEALRLAHRGDPRFELLEGFAYGIGSEPSDYKQAVDWTNTAAAHPQLSDDVALQIVQQFDQLGLPAQSLTTLQTVVEHGAGPELRHILAKRLWELGQWARAADAFADVNPQDPSSDPTLVALKAITLANLGKSAEANAARAALASRKQAAAKAWTLLLQRIIDASQLDDKRVVADCRSALMLDLQNPFLAYYLGDADYRLGEVEQAIQAWTVSQANEATWSTPGVRLVEALLQSDRPEQAQAVAGQALRHSHSADAAMALARAYSNDKNATAEQVAFLSKLVDDVQRTLPNDERSQLLRIEWLCRQDKKGEARDAALAAIRHEPAPSESFLLGLADKSRQFGLNLQQECFAASRKANGMTPGLAYAKAVDRYLAGQKEQALAGFDADAREAGKPQGLNWREARARLLDFTSSPDAKATWIRLGDEFPKDVSLQHALLNAHCVQGDWDAIKKVIDRLKSLVGENSLEWRVAEARLMVESPRNESDYEQGALRLDDILKMDPNNIQAHVLLARALVHMKQTDGAIEQLSIAAKEDKFSVPIALQLAALLQSRGDFERVQKELDRVSPWIHTPTERQQAAELLVHQGDSDRALQVFEHATTQPGDNSEAQPDLFLAEIYRRRRQFDKADAVVRKLMEHPDLATIRFAASLYAKEGYEDQAQAALARLDELKLDPGIKELVLGSFFADRGQLPKAMEHYQLATAQAPSNPIGWRLLANCQFAAGKPDDAVATIDKGSQVLPASPVLAAIKANEGLLRQAGAVNDRLSIVLYVMNDPLNSDAAIELLKTLVDADQSNDVQRLASRLQQLVERHPDFLPAQLQLAQCLASMRRFDEALTVANHASNGFPSSPEPPRLAVRICAAAGRWQEMKDTAELLKTRTIEDPMAADVEIAQALIRLSQFDAAIAQVQPYMRAAAADPDRYAEVVLTQGAALARSDKSKAAADLLWPLVEKSLEWRIRWLEIALEIPDTAESLRWIDRLSGAVPQNSITERIGLAETYDILGTRAKDPAILQKAESEFTQILAEPSVTADAVLAAGASSERHGDMATAEKRYRRALELNPKLWTAHNNLAMAIVRRGGDPKEAAVHAAMAVKLQPHQATLRDTLAQAQADSGNAKAAAENERLAVQLDPDDPRWHVRLAKYLLDGGDMTAAREAVRTLDSQRLDMARLTPDQQAVLAREMAAVRKRVAEAKTL